MVVATTSVTISADSSKLSESLITAFLAPSLLRVWKIGAIGNLIASNSGLYMHINGGWKMNVSKLTTAIGEKSTCHCPQLFALSCGLLPCDISTLLQLLIIKLN